MDPHQYHASLIDTYSGNWGGWTRTTNIRINSAALCH